MSRNTLPTVTKKIKNHIGQWLLWTGLSVLPATTLATQTEYGSFYHYDIKQGLVSNRIFSICSDSSDYIWVATDFGLERFDGRHFKNYQQKDYPNFRRQDVFFISALDKTGLVGGGYGGQLFVYDTERDSALDIMDADYRKEYSKIAFNLIKSYDGKKYVLTDMGVYQIDLKKRQISSKFAAFDNLKSVYIRSAFIDQKKRIWIGTYEKVIAFDPNGKELHSHTHNGKPLGVVMNIVDLKDGRIAACTFSNEIWVYDTRKDKIEAPEVINTPFSNIYYVLNDHNGRTWFGTDGYGLWYADKINGNQTKFVHIEPYNNLANETKKIYALCEDMHGDLWIGTQNSGLWKYRSKNDKGLYFSDEWGFPATVCSSFLLRKNGDLIVGTDGGGIYRLRTQDKSAYHYTTPGDNIVAMSLNKDENKVSVASWGSGLFTLDMDHNSCQAENYPANFNPTNNYFGAHIMKNGEWWACAAGDGFYIKKGNWEKYDYQKFNRDDVSKWVVKAEEDNEGNKWLMTTNNVCKIKPDNKPLVFEPNRVIGKDNINLNDIAVDQQGNLMLASNYGLYYLAKNAKDFVKVDIVPENDYHSVRTDMQGNFWAAGDGIIISVNMNKKEIRRLDGDFKDLTKFYFYPRASYLDRYGNIYFGTNGGFFRFHPQKINSEPSIKHLGFDMLTVKGQKVKPYTGVLSDGTLNQIKKLQLNYDETEISLEITFTDYAEWNPARCKYKIEGVNENWIELGGGRTINLNHIPTGNHQLIVCVYRPNVADSEQYLKLDLVILPPWWQTWWFVMMMLILLGILVVLYIKYKLKQSEKQKDELKEKVAERTLALSTALNEKDRLISVIAHDLKNPMFAIESGLECLCTHKEMQTTDRENRLNELHNSAQILQHKMNQLLEWALGVQDNDKSHIACTNLEQTVKNAIQMLKTMAKEKNIRINLQSNLNHYALADDRMLEIVIENLIANSIKFTSDGGEITVNCAENDGKAQIIIADNGKGMTEQQLKSLSVHSLHASTSGTKNEKGTGLGIKLCQDYVAKNNGEMQISSVLGQGTTITIELPTTDIKLNKRNPVQTDAANNEKTETDENKWHVVVTDDDELICHNIADMLSEVAEVTTAHNGQEALDAINREEPDLVLSDIEMPIMNGIELSEQLAQQEHTAHIPLLFISARTAESDRLIGLASGAVDYICKPFNHDELLIKVKNILGKRQKIQQKLMENYCEKQTDEEQIKEIDPYLKKLLDFIEINYANSELSIVDIAQEMASSQSTLNRKIKVLTQKNPIEILSDFRLNKAQQLLKQGNRNIADVAFATGYSDPAYFSRKYKEKFGHSPSKEE